MSSVKIRCPEERDRTLALEMLRDAEVMRFLGPHRPLTQTEAMDWFDDALHKPSRFAIADAKTDEFIGFCGLKKINDIWDFGYFLRSEFWGRGIATEACRIVIERLSTQADFSNTQVFIADDNKASKRVAEKLGWNRRQSGYNNGEFGHFYLIAP